MSDFNCNNSSRATYSIVLVNYKTYQLTSHCLDLLYKYHKGSDVKVWVVDNDSNDKSTDYLRDLEWINLIERKHVPGEEGFISHGRALDLVLNKIATDYLFLLHSDTLIYDDTIFEIMLEQCLKNERVLAVGCVEQLYRGNLRTVWRFISKFIKFYYRKIKILLGFKSRSPKPYFEVHLKSFCALWNTRILKENSLSFAMNGRLPGYEAQDQLIKQGYVVSYISAKKMFSYLDHVKAGTILTQSQTQKNHRRAKKHSDFMQNLTKV